MAKNLVIDDKLRTKKDELSIIEKCKTEVNNNAMQNKEKKFHAI